jgi:molybdopterin synthase catalytic subunit
VAPITIRIQAEPIDAGAELARFSAARGSIGAVVSFTGLCRNEGGRLAALHIEHYPGMAEEEIARIAGEVRTRFGIAEALVIHRHGRVLPGECIVFLATSATHRAGAFAAADFLMDYLKTCAPFWKKEEGAEGAWIEAKASDAATMERWRKP